MSQVLTPNRAAVRFFILGHAVAPVAAELVHEALYPTPRPIPVESAKDRKNRLAREKRAAKKLEAMTNASYDRYARGGV
jgi:hypothetical protein